LNPTHRVTGTPDFSFVQISDSHIGFHQAANKNVVGTFEEVVRRINALPQRPAFVVHTGDHVHLSRMAEFDTVKQIMTAGAKNLWYAATCAAQLWREKERGDDGDAADTHSHKRPVSPPYSLGSRTSPLRSIR
jgi:3',5'-cyclic AMP phosphodiesterase CpdA